MPDSEVDQSMHIERTQQDTILALSNAFRYTIRVPAAVKRAAIHFLRQKTKYRLSKRRITLQMFVAALYLLLKEYIVRLEQVTIDVEYVGHESEIKGMVLEYFHREGIHVPSDRIVFRQIGKDSRAHELAIRTYRGELAEDRRITEEEFLAVLK